MATRIYTRGGDHGETGLWGGTRVAKSHLRVEAYGTVDELNACLGLALAGGLPDAVRGVVTQVQGHLFSLGAELATPAEAAAPPGGLRDADVTGLERAIDEAEARLPVLRTFILPGGHVGAARLHVARAVCRRAERLVVALRAAEPDTRVLTVTYLNRLGDLLFVMARLCNLEAGEADVPWQARAASEQPET